MKRSAFLWVAVATVAGVVAFAVTASGRPDEEASPIYGVKIPSGYRDWKLIAVNHLLLAGKGDQLRAQLGNDIALKTFKEGTLPFPDGAIIAAIHWTRVPSENNNKVLNGPFPGAQSFVVSRLCLHPLRKGTLIRRSATDKDGTDGHTQINWSYGLVTPDSAPQWRSNGSPCGIFACCTQQ